MKKCAKCDSEYDDAYDGCPVCAKAAAEKVVPGNLMSALLSLAAFLFVAFVTTIIGNTLIALSILASFALIVATDATAVRSPDARGNVVPGVIGSHPLVWGLAVLAVPIITIPLYFYERPRIAQAFKRAGIPETKEGPATEVTGPTFRWDM